MSATFQQDRGLGAFYGLALGDALGMPTQSLPRALILQRYGRISTLIGADADQPIAPNMPAGAITDDTEQAILVAQLLVAGGGSIDPTALAHSLIEWEAAMKAKGSYEELPIFDFKEFCGLIGFQEVWDFEKRWAKAR